jgi:4-hydroxy-L-threonine phosphate dehydrogenase PdxA
MHQEDELRWVAEQLDYKGVCSELNVLKNLWTSRVTSHVALRVAVCGLNLIAKRYAEQAVAGEILACPM